MPEDEVLNTDAVAQITEISDQLKAFVAHGTEDQALAFLSSGGYSGFFWAPVPTPAQDLAMAGSSLAHPQARPARLHCTLSAHHEARPAHPPPPPRLLQSTSQPPTRPPTSLCPNPSHTAYPAYHQLLPPQYHVPPSTYPAATPLMAGSRPPPSLQNNAPPLTSVPPYPYTHVGSGSSSVLASTNWISPRMMAPSTPSVGSTGATNFSRVSAHTRLTKFGQQGDAKFWYS